MSRPLSKILFAVWVLLSCAVDLLAAEPPTVAASLLVEADEAFSEERREAARTLYARVLQHDPGQSRAVYQLARLAKPGSSEARARFRHYTQLEPDDPWGYMAYGDSLARAGMTDEALRQYAVAERILPGHADVQAGEARALQRAGRVSALMTHWEEWLRDHGDDALAWGELGLARQRARWHESATAAYERSLVLSEDRTFRRKLDDARSKSGFGIEPAVNWTRDSDDVETFQQGVRLEWGMLPRLRAGIAADHIRVTDPEGSGEARRLGVTGIYRPTPALMIEGVAGRIRLDSDGRDQDPAAQPWYRLRMRWRGDIDAPAAEARYSRYPLFQTSGLVAEPVELSEFRAWYEHPIHRRWHVRAGFDAASLEETLQHNTRSGLQGGLIHRWSQEGEVSLFYKRSGYEKRSLSPYFSPDLVELVEFGTWFEISDGLPFTLSFDGAVGRQRIQRFGEPVRDWTMAWRLYTSMEWQLSSMHRLLLEYEFNSLPIGDGEQVAGSDWKWHSLSLSWRAGIPIVRQDSSRPGRDRR